jgi:hypothetical protein
MRHSALRNWLLRLSNWRSCQRSGATLSAGTAAAAATALVLPLLDALVVLLPLLVLVDFVLLALLEVLVLLALLFFVVRGGAGWCGGEGSHQRSQCNFVLIIIYSLVSEAEEIITNLPLEAFDTSRIILVLFFQAFAASPTFRWRTCGR